MLKFQTYNFSGGPSAEVRIASLLYPNGLLVNASSDLMATLRILLPRAIGCTDPKICPHFRNILKDWGRIGTKYEQSTKHN